MHRLQKVYHQLVRQLEHDPGLAVQIILAVAAIGSLIYTGRSVEIQNYMAQIERTPVVYVSCYPTAYSAKRPLAGLMLFPGFDSAAVWSAFPKMYSANGQASAVFPSATVQHCVVQNFGRLPVEQLRLPVVVRLVRLHSAQQKCTSTPCSYDYEKDAAVEIRTLLPTYTMNVSPFTIEPGGVRTFNVGNDYRQWLEFEFGATAQAEIPPDTSPASVPVVVGSFQSSHMLSPASDCAPPGYAHLRLRTLHPVRC
jgi:hypothetical protein